MTPALARHATWIAESFVMSAAHKLSLISVEDYLAAELRSETKHEYLGGVIHAMAGGSFNHNTIALNVATTLRTQLRGKRCRPFNSDTKIRVDLPNLVKFYYPDASVICEPLPPQQSFHNAPVVVVEVLSRSTRRIDMDEKKNAYLAIPSLVAYIMIEQNDPLAVVFRRSQEDVFQREVYEGLDAVIHLPEIETDLALSDVYEDVTFTPEPDEET